MDLKPVGKKADLHRRAFRIDAVIPVDQRIQDRLANGLHRILRTVTSGAGVGIDNRAELHVPATEAYCLLHHRINGALNALIVNKPGRICISITNLRSRYYYCGDAQLRKIALRVEAEVQHGGQCHFFISCDVQHFQRLLTGKLGKSGTIRPALKDITLQLIRIQHSKIGTFHRTFIIMQMMAKCFVTVKLIIRHGQVCIAHADIGAFDTPSTAIIAGALRQIHSRDLGGTDPFAIGLSQREHGANRRFHLIALLCNFFL